MFKKGRLIIIIAMILGIAFIVTGCAKKKIVSAPTGEKEEIYSEMEDRNATQRELERKRKAEEGVEEYQLTEKQRIEKEQRDKVEADIEQTLKKRIHFDFDSFELKQEAREILKQKAKLLKEYKDLNVVIEGHCDERGTDEYNLALGERRARAAYEFLVLLGVDPERLNIISYGEEKPLDPGHNESAWAKNRRAEFRINKD